MNIESISPKYNKDTTKDTTVDNTIENIKIIEEFQRVMDVFERKVNNNFDGEERRKVASTIIGIVYDRFHIDHMKKLPKEIVNKILSNLLPPTPSRKRIIFNNIEPRFSMQKSKAFNDLMLPRELEKQAIASGLFNIACVSKDMNERAKETKKNWVNDEGISLRTYGCRNVEKAVNFVINHNLSSANLEDSWLKSFNDDNLKTLIDHCPQLNNLSIHCDCITDKGLECLEELSNLKKLTLISCEITDKSIEYIKKVPNLEELNLLNVRMFTYKGLEHLKELSSVLKKIVLDVCYIQVKNKVNKYDVFQDKHLEHFKELKNLEEFYLLGEEGRSPIKNGIKHLTQLTALKRLTLWCPGATEENIKFIKPLKKLEELELLNSHIADEGLFECLKGLSALKKLSLKENPNISCEGIFKCLKKFRALEELKLSNCSSVLTWLHCSDDLKEIDSYTSWRFRKREIKGRKKVVELCWSRNIRQK